MLSESGTVEEHAAPNMVMLDHGKPIGIEQAHPGHDPPNLVGSHASCSRKVRSRQGIASLQQNPEPTQDAFNFGDRLTLELRHKDGRTAKQVKECRRCR